MGSGASHNEPQRRRSSSTRRSSRRPSTPDPGPSSDDDAWNVFTAAAKENTRVLRRLLSNGANARQTDRFGRTALHACRNAACARALVTHSPELLTTADNQGLLPVHGAAINNSAAVLEVLLDGDVRAMVDAVDREGRVPLHWAVVNAGLGAIEVLLEHGASPNLRDRPTGATPLHYAVRLFEEGDLKRIRAPDVMRTLLRNGADHEAADLEGRTPLIWSATTGATDAIDILLEARASEASADRAGLTALHCAVTNGHNHVLQLLLTRHAVFDVDRPDRRGATPLLYAAVAGNTEAVHLLLELGADVDWSDDRQRTALHCAAQMGHTDTVRLLMEVGGADPQLPDSSGLNALHLASRKGHDEVCRVLLDLGASTNAVVVGNGPASGTTALDLARNRACVAVLRDYGAVKTGRRMSKVLEDVELQQTLLVTEIKEEEREEKEEEEEEKKEEEEEEKKEERDDAGEDGEEEKEKRDAIEESGEEKNEESEEIKAKEEDEEEEKDEKKSSQYVGYTEVRHDSYSPRPQVIITYESDDNNVETSAKEDGRNKEKEYDEEKKEEDEADTKEQEDNEEEEKKVEEKEKEEEEKEKEEEEKEKEEEEKEKEEEEEEENDPGLKDSCSSIRSKERPGSSLRSEKTRSGASQASSPSSQRSRDSMEDPQSSRTSFPSSERSSKSPSRSSSRRSRKSTGTSISSERSFQSWRRSQSLRASLSSTSPSREAESTAPVSRTPSTPRLQRPTSRRLTARPRSALSLANERQIHTSVSNFTAVRRAAKEATELWRCRMRYATPMTRDFYLRDSFSRSYDREARKEEEKEEERKTKMKEKDAEMEEQMSTTRRHFDSVDDRSSESLQQARDFNSKSCEDFKKRQWHVFPIHQVATRRPIASAKERPRTATGWRQKRPDLADSPPPIRRQQPSRLSSASPRV